MTTGRLFLVPAPLDFGCAEQAPLTDVLPDLTLRQAAALQHWVCENAKTTRAYLKRVQAIYPLPCALQDMAITELPREAHKKGDHVGASSFDAKPLLKAALAGHDIGLVSEAGMPAVADPGSSVVRAAHELGVPVLPLVGPVSLLLALAASGLNGQNFAFVGYLPQDAVDRKNRLQDLEQLAHKTSQTQLFIETPFRNAALWRGLLEGLQPQTRLAISYGISLAHGGHFSQTVKAWRQSHPSACPAGDLPAVFGLGR